MNFAAERSLDAGAGVASARPMLKSPYLALASKGSERGGEVAFKISKGVPSPDADADANAASGEARERVKGSVTLDLDASLPSKEGKVDPSVLTFAGLALAPFQAVLRVVQEQEALYGGDSELGTPDKAGAPTEGAHPADQLICDIVASASVGRAKGALVDGVVSVLDEGSYRQATAMAL